jgi:hypothetical protein
MKMIINSCDFRLSPVNQLGLPPAYLAALRVLVPNYFGKAVDGFKPVNGPEKRNFATLSTVFPKFDRVRR